MKRLWSMWCPAVKCFYHCLTNWENPLHCRFIASSPLSLISHSHSKSIQMTEHNHKLIPESWVLICNSLHSSGFSLSTRCRNVAAGICSQSDTKGPTLMLCDQLWLAVGVPVHPKVGWVKFFHTKLWKMFPYRAVWALCTGTCCNKKGINTLV